MSESDSSNLESEYKDMMVYTRELVQESDT